ncbi:tyrosine-type recombinase/integrase [Rathayibacter rathayi]|uniref:tyrosine-type recombinase/integrase n=1 Tax=Rathayibacter rathayi TaxID=33887 RepID=UPI003B9677C9
MPESSDSSSSSASTARSTTPRSASACRGPSSSRSADAGSLSLLRTLRGSGPSSLLALSVSCTRPQFSTWARGSSRYVNDGESRDAPTSRADFSRRRTLNNRERLGEVLRSRGFRRRWLDAPAQSIGRPGLMPHELRHTAASLAISAGANATAVQHLLGRASAAVTLDVYADLVEDDLDAVEAAWVRRSDAFARTLVSR